MKKTPEIYYSKTENIVFIRNFEVRLGITTNDFGSTQLDSRKEPRLNRDLLNITKAHFFAKIRAQHSDKIIVVNRPNNAYYDCDALIACLRALPAVPLLLANTADCPIIAIADRRRSILALVHSGWQGCHLNIVGKTVTLMLNKFKASPELLDAYVWPGICKKHYYVGRDVARLFPKWVSSDARLNLKGVIIEQLLNAGLSNDNIYASKRCSYCTIDGYDNYYRRPKYLFASFRRSTDAQKKLETSERDYQILTEAHQSKKRNCVFLTIKP